MKYTIAAKPTLYKGIQYRSRLEATWACFFELAGIKYEYEPYDLPGWSPAGYGEYLVEVKPVMKFTMRKKIRYALQTAKLETRVILLGVAAVPIWGIWERNCFPTWIGLGKL